MKTILDLSNEEARTFFLRQENYCTLDFPAYFNFQPLIDALWSAMNGKELKNMRQKNPKDLENVNYTLYTNKDGSFAWRPLQLIHPAIYVELVQKMTEPNEWNIIVERFKQFRENANILCCSIPIVSYNSGSSTKKETILNWWERNEQQSILYALDYKYVLNTDITDCYGSIYTHTIPWALHERDVIKKNRCLDKAKQTHYIGDDIDTIIQSMSYAQTNGIPQGSIVTDFIAEMILGYADLELTRKITTYNSHNLKNGIYDYKILRYRDDYRIFSKTQEDAVKIVKLLTEVLQGLNLKINTQKTFISNEIIRDSIKPDKLYWNEAKQKDTNLQKHLLLIYSLSLKYPNSGSIAKALDELYDKLYPLAILKNDWQVKVLVSIVVEIMYKNPRVYPIACAIIAKLLSLEMDKAIRKDIYHSIWKKFETIPNAGHLQVWLQRTTIHDEIDIEYEEPLCSVVIGKHKKIWNIDWLQKPIQDIFCNNSIINAEIKQSISRVPKPEEIKIFVY